MSLFQLYETQRKPFTAGKRWICRNPTSVGFPSSAQGEIIEILENGEVSSRYKVIRGTFVNKKYNCSRSTIVAAYEPYNGPI